MRSRRAAWAQNGVAESGIGASLPEVTGEQHLDRKSSHQRKATVCGVLVVSGLGHGNRCVDNRFVVARCPPGRRHAVPAAPRFTMPTGGPREAGTQTAAPEGRSFISRLSAERPLAVVAGLAAPLGRSAVEVPGMTTKAREPAYTVLSTVVWRGVLRPLRTPGVSRRCRSNGRTGGFAPGPPHRCAPGGAAHRCGRRPRHAGGAGRLRCGAGPPAPQRRGAARTR